jgi:citrate lyase subunit beta/citryl-CoA lyase
MAGLGAGDLAADLGVGATADAGQWAEGWVVFQSRALGLLPPPMSVFPDIRNLGSLRSDCLRGRALGFYGRSAINPAQVDVINRAFTPPGEEVARAREIVRSLQDPGSGVTVVGGHVVDAATVKNAERVIALASQYSDGSASA